jgi:hypothetical protein
VVECRGPTSGHALAVPISRCKVTRLVVLRCRQLSGDFGRGKMRVMQAAITTAVSVFRSCPEMTDEEIYRVLVSKDIERRLAARLVEFLPAAYCRVILEPTGARFPDTFQRLRKDGTTVEPVPLASEQVWTAALDCARGEIGRRLSRDDKLGLAGRSAEFRAANDLLKRGSKLQNIVFTPAVYQWPEEGPEI